MDVDPIVEDWRRILASEHEAWVIFKNGTCVVAKLSDDDLAGHAASLLKEWGPVHAGTPSGDFAVRRLAEDGGWVVTCHHPDILTYVSLDEVMLPETPEMIVGLLGRSKRQADAEALEILHIEDRRSQ
jgi:hypothetical protein